MSFLNSRPLRFASDAFFFALDNGFFCSSIMFVAIHQAPVAAGSVVHVAQALDKL